MDTYKVIAAVLLGFFLLTNKAATVEIGGVLLIVLAFKIKKLSNAV